MRGPIQKRDDEGPLDETARRRQLARDDQPACAARALLLQGRLLAARARYREAAGPLARGWQLAVSRGGTAGPAGDRR
jgi:hypothetical protein